jgi:hypothetical protein
MFSGLPEAENHDNSGSLACGIRAQDGSATAHKGGRHVKQVL